MADDQAFQSEMSLHTGGSEANAIDFIVRQIMGRMATATLVQVKTVDPTAKTVSIQPMVNQLDGFGKAVPHGTINNVPYFRLQGGLNAVIIDPAVGDIGVAVFGHTDLSSVKQTKKVANPGSRRRFDWADAIYMGGVLNGAPTQFLQIAADAVTITGTGTVTINAPTGVTVNTNTATITASDSVTLDTPTVHATGDITCDGKITTADLTATGAVELDEATVSGNITAATITGTTDVIGGGKSLKTHTHGGVQTGTGTSGPPS